MPTTNQCKIPGRKGQRMLPNVRAPARSDSFNLFKDTFGISLRATSDGERCKELVEWLKDLPTGQDILREQFGGRPVNEQNLSEWKVGGKRPRQVAASVYFRRLREIRPFARLRP